MNDTKIRIEQKPRINPNLAEIIKWNVIERGGQKIIFTRFKEDRFTIIRPDELGMVEEEYISEERGIYSNW